jgi:UDP-N-acetylglucosamine 4-epimerase
MLEQKAWGLGAINICSGREVSINSLLSLIQEELGSTMQPIYEPERAGDVRRHKGDCSLYEQLIHQGAAEELNISGLKETISFYVSTTD